MTDHATPPDEQSLPDPSSMAIPATIRGNSLWSDAWKRLKKNRRSNSLTALPSSPSWVTSITAKLHFSIIFANPV